MAAGGWDKLESAFRENAQEIERERKLKPQRCPHDGMLLEERDGIRNCPMGNYTWEG